MNRRILLALVAAFGLFAVAGAAIANERSAAAEAVPSTAAFHDLDQAVAAGYSFRLPELSGRTCIEQPGEGAMGVHMVNLDLVLDGAIDATKPDVLVYEPRSDGSLKLVAVEYVVFVGAWTGDDPPALFGREFDLVGEPNRYGLPAFYALHSWIWTPNPSGLLHAWNPRVACDGS